MWHSLDESGHISSYDVLWPNGDVEINIPTELLESVMEGEHEMDEQHGIQEQSTPVRLRKYKV